MNGSIHSLAALLEGLWFNGIEVWGFGFRGAGCFYEESTAQILM